MVALGSLGTKLYFLNWLVAVAAIKFIASCPHLTWQFCNWTLRIVGNFVPHFGEGWKMARSWLLLSPSVLSRKGWKVSWQEVTTPHASSLWPVDSFVAHFHTRDLCSLLSAELELLSSADMTAPGGRMWDMSRVGSPRTVSGVSRTPTTTQFTEREPHHTLLAAPPQQCNTRSPQTTLHYPG